MRAGELFLTRLPRPLETKTGRELGRQLFHFRHGGAGAVARSGGASNAHCRIAVVAHGLLRALDPADAGERGQRYELALAIAHVDLQQIPLLHACGGVGLYHDALQASLVREVVHVARTQCRGERRIDGIERHAQGIGFVTVDVDLQLRRILQSIRADLGEDFALGGHAKELVARVNQGLVSGPAAVLQAEGEARSRVQFRNGRRAQREDEGIPHPHQGTHGAARHRFGRLPGAFAFGPVLECHECQGGILALARKTKAQHAHHALDFRLLEDEAFDLLHHGERALLSGAGWQLHVDDDVALVFIGQERSRQARVHHSHRAHDGSVDHEVAHGFLQDAADHALVGFCGTAEASVEPAEKPFLLMVVPCLYGLQQGCAQCRCE